MSNISHDERERLERQANLVRARLATTLDVLDKRGHEMVDVKLQVRRHVVPLAVVAGTAALVVASGVGWAVYRLVTRDERKRRARRRLPAVVWNHPERIARVQKPPVLAELGRKLLVGTLTMLGMSLIRRAIDVPLITGRARSVPSEPATGELLAHHR
jgi:hypothetical protein